MRSGIGSGFGTGLGRFEQMNQRRLACFNPAGERCEDFSATGGSSAWRMSKMVCGKLLLRGLAGLLVDYVVPQNVTTRSNAAIRTSIRMVPPPDTTFPRCGSSPTRALIAS